MAFGMKLSHAAPPAKAATSTLRSTSITAGAAMIPVRDLFETHLTVVDLQRSMAFFSQVLGLELAEVFLDRKVAFYWIGGPITSSQGSPS
jgi:hypothetical protein